MKGPVSRSVMERQSGMVRRMQVRKLGDGQRAILMMGTEGPVTRETLETRGLKAALHSLKRLMLPLIDEHGRTTEAGVQALRDGNYPLELDPLHGAFEANVRTLMVAWRVKRTVAIHRAVANAAAAIDVNRKGES